MPDDSELDYLKTWLDEVTTNLTIETFETARTIGHVSGTKKALIFPGETMNVDALFYKKRYLIQISTETEITHMALINEIIIGANLYNTTRSGLTSVAVMCNIQYAYGSRCFVEINGRWSQDLWIDVRWASS